VEHLLWDLDVVDEFPSGFADETQDCIVVAPEMQGWFIDQADRNWILFTTKRVTRTQRKRVTWAELRM
jgi:hypothetical protein